MCAVIAHFSSPSGPVRLEGSGEVTRALPDLELADGHYALFGKVVVANTDLDPQNARVQLRRSERPEGPFTVLDESFARIGPLGRADRLSVAVEWRVYVTGIDFIGIGCSTHRGVAADARLTAIRIDFE